MEPESPVPPPAAEPGTAPAPEPVPTTEAPVPPAGPSEEEEEKRRKRRMLLLLFLLLLLIAALALLSGWYLMYRKPVTELLPPVGENAVPHYLFSIYGVAAPMGVAATASGDRVYVTESSGERVTRIFDRDGRPLGQLRPPEDNLPDAPVYVAIDPQNGEVYVTDRVTGSIHIYDSSGAYQRAFKPTVPIQGWQPLGIAFAPNGDLWVTDLSAPYHRLEVFDRAGTQKQVIGQQGQFDFPNMIAFDATGNAYVSNSNIGRVVVLDPSGTEIAGISRGPAAGALGLPRGVAVDDTGRLYVVDATGQTVHLYHTGTPDDWRPAFIGEFGTEGVADGEFEYPNGVATDTRARVYITDRENDRVQVWGY